MRVPAPSRLFKKPHRGQSPRERATAKEDEGAIFGALLDQPAQATATGLVPKGVAGFLLAATGLVFTGVAGSLFKGSLRAVSHAWLACSLLAGCDLFGTKEFSPRPAEIKAFAGTLTRRDTIAFRITESLALPGAESPDTVLARRRIHFAKADDPFQPSDGWIAVSFRVYADPPAAVLDEGLYYVRFDADGLSVKAPAYSSDGANGVRYYPLKVAADRAAASGDSGSFLSLPPAFLMGGTWTQALGVLTVGREVSDLDTLEYRGHLEESWRIDETVSEGGRFLARGTFWYGATGLLKGKLAWSLEERGADGVLVALKELRRELERL